MNYEIKFSQNWNKKLNCQAFTTIRRPSAFWVVGREYRIYLNGVHVKDAKLIEIIHGDPRTLTETMARLDTGYDKRETLDILAKMYNGLPPEIFYMTFITTRVNEEGFKLRLAEAAEKLSEQMTLGLTGK